MSSFSSLLTARGGEWSFLDMCSLRIHWQLSHLWPPGDPWEAIKSCGTGSTLPDSFLKNARNPRDPELWWSSGIHRTIAWNVTNSPSMATEAHIPASGSEDLSWSSISKTAANLRKQKEKKQSKCRIKSRKVDGSAVRRTRLLRLRFVPPRPTFSFDVTRFLNDFC